MNQLFDILLCLCLVVIILLNALLCISIIKANNQGTKEEPSQGVTGGIVEVAGGIFRRANKKRRPSISTDEDLWKLEQDHPGTKPMR